MLGDGRAVVSRWMTAQTIAIGSVTLWIKYEEAGPDGTSCARQGSTGLPQFYLGHCLRAIHVDLTPSPTPYYIFPSHSTDAFQQPPSASSTRNASTATLPTRRKTTAATPRRTLRPDDPRAAHAPAYRATRRGTSGTETRWMNWMMRKRTRWTRTKTSHRLITLRGCLRLPLRHRFGTPHIRSTAILFNPTTPRADLLHHGGRHLPQGTASPCHAARQPTRSRAANPWIARPAENARRKGSGIPSLAAWGIGTTGRVRLRRRVKEKPRRA